LYSGLIWLHALHHSKEARYREQQIRSLAKRAQRLGLQLVIPHAA